MISLDSSHEEVLAELQRIREMYILKHTMRFKSTRDFTNHSESVAEHIFGMYVICDYFLGLEDPQVVLDRNRIHELILFHELGEIETGDISLKDKTEEHRIFERGAAARVAGRLPGGVGEKALERFQEFEAGSTPEAQFAVAIDKIEPIFEMSHPLGVPLFKSQGFTQEVSTNGKRAAVQGRYPYMSLFLDAWTEWMVSQKAFAE